MREERDALRVELAKYKSRSEGTTHATGCWAWGREHYLCAEVHIKAIEESSRKVAQGFVVAEARYIGLLTAHGLSLAEITGSFKQANRND
jgi:hypothetical protein